MNDTSDTSAKTGGDSPEYLAYREKAKGTNINEQTLLATDYLNHFNEIVMTLEMIPDMPEFLDEAKEWKPKSYKDHFRDSTIADKDLAIEAFDHSPIRFRQPFEVTISTIDQLIAMAIERAEAAAGAGETERLRETLTEASRGIQRLMDMASANIHGSETTMDQSEIDNLLNL